MVFWIGDLLLFDSSDTIKKIITATISMSNSPLILLINILCNIYIQQSRIQLRKHINDNTKTMLLQYTVAQFGFQIWLLVKESLP